MQPEDQWQPRKLRDKPKQKQLKGGRCPAPGETSTKSGAPLTATTYNDELLQCATNFARNITQRECPGDGDSEACVLLVEKLYVVAARSIMASSQIMFIRQNRPKKSFRVPPLNHFSGDLA